MGGATVRDVCSAELDVSCEVSGFCAFAAACELSVLCALSAGCENGNHFLAKVEKILFPIADYTVQIKSYETDAESTLSYEMILAMEALDEN